MPDPHPIRVARIVTKLAQARARGLKCFGSESHGFRLAPPADEATVAAFEATHSVTLPADYRAFLTLAGHGGAGPDYGVYPLDRWNDLAEWVADGPVPADFLARPSPLTPGAAPRDPAFEHWPEQFAPESPYQGAISIGTSGCSGVTLLIVTGVYAGRVVAADADGHPAYVSREPDFLAWYERWLDEVLAGEKHTSWSGYGPNVTEAELLALVDHPQSDAGLRGEAVQSLTRKPALAPPTVARVAGFLADAAPEVRVAACQVAGRHKLTASTEAVTSLLADGDAAVRRAAAEALHALGGPGWVAALKGRLRFETDRDAAGRLFYHLKEAKALTRADLLALLDGGHAAGLRSSAAHAMEWTPADVPRLVALLGDAEEGLRRSAVWELTRLKGAAATPAVLARLAAEPDAGIADHLLRFLGEVRAAEAVPTLLEWAGHADDFHRLAAFEALCQIGDPRAAGVAAKLLKVKRQPRRSDADGGIGNVNTIATLAKKALAASPSEALRRLGW